MNDGVFSFWKGLKPEKLLPDLLRGTYLEITSTISTRARMSSVSFDMGTKSIKQQLYYMYFPVIF
jgi:hypothetical protein